MSNGGAAAGSKAVRLLELAAPFLAIFGLTASMLPDYLQMSRLGYPGVDFKVVYVSTWLFAHGQDPYNLTLAPAVYQMQGLAAPATMFGHAPVYPAFTYLVLSPLALLRGPAAVWCALLLSALLMAFAVSALVRFSRVELRLTLPWRLLIVACCAACPLLAFALQIGNLSVAAAALSIIALLWTDRRPRVAAMLLALALCLKPHLAVWFLIALALGFGKSGRRTSILATAWVLLVTLVTVCWLSGHALLGATLQSFQALLQAEQGSGSMSAASREVLPLGGQITAFLTMPGFFEVAAAPAGAFWLAAVLGLGVGLGYTVWRARGVFAGPAQRLLFAGAMLAFGLTANYHRAHDAVALLLLLPVLAAAMRENRKQPIVWLVVAALLCLCIPWGTARSPQAEWHQFLLLRQAALAAFVLCIAFTWLLTKKMRHERCSVRAGRPVTQLAPDLHRE